MFNQFAHSSLCDSATTENLDSIPSSILTTGRRIALEESDLSCEFTGLLTIRLQKRCQEKLVIEEKEATNHVTHLIRDIL